MLPPTTSAHQLGGGAYKRFAGLFYHQISRSRTRFGPFASRSPSHRVLLLTDDNGAQCDTRRHKSSLFVLSLSRSRATRSLTTPSPSTIHSRGHSNDFPDHHPSRHMLPTPPLIILAFAIAFLGSLFFCKGLSLFSLCPQHHGILGK